jgi:hypothetical protein
MHVDLSTRKNMFRTATKSADSSEQNEFAKVAILDSGCRLQHGSFTTLAKDSGRKIQDWKDFVDEELEPSRGNELLDNVGHGTMCTHILLQTTRFVNVYNGRVFDKVADRDVVRRVAKVSISGSSAVASPFLPRDVNSYY